MSPKLRRIPPRPPPSCLLATVDFSPEVGGIQRYYCDLCRESSSRISVLAPASRGAETFDSGQPFKIMRAPVPTGSHPMSRALLTALMGLYVAAAAVFGHYRKLIAGTWFLLSTILWVGKVFGLGTAVVLHGGELQLSPFGRRSAFRRAIVWMLNRCDQVIVNSSYTGDQVIQLGVRKSIITVVTPGVDRRRFESGSRQISRRTKGNDLAEGAILLTVGRLVERKNHGQVISLMPRLLQKHPGTRYVVVGDGPCRRRLIALAEGLGMQGDVEFVGKASDEEVVQWLHTCDIFVMPSKLIDTPYGVEGFGIAYLEANACGKPVVAGNSGGVTDAVVNGVTGVLVDPEDENSLFNALDRLIAQKSLRDALGENGRRRVIKDFDWASRVEQFLR